MARIIGPSKFPALTPRPGTASPGNLGLFILRLLSSFMLWARKNKMKRLVPKKRNIA